LGHAPYFRSVFVRKNKNRSGSISVQVVKKLGRSNKLITTIGTSFDSKEVDNLVRRAKAYIDKQKRQMILFASQEYRIVQDFVAGLSNDDLHIVGPRIILDKIFSSMGYDQVDPQGLFGHLVCCRITYPGSKLRTVQYMSRHYKVDVSAQTVYRYLDRLDESTKTQVEQITYQHVNKQLGGDLGIVFYDMTSLYFETESQDDLRKIGYSKDGKHQHPQIMLGLLVGAGGVPIAYQVFEGNTSETKTLLPLLDLMIQRFKIQRPVIVADSALLSKSNLLALQENDYQYILGARIKNEAEVLKKLILRSQVEESKPIRLKHAFGQLIVSYSAKRAAKDLYNRTKGLKRLEAKLQSGKLSKTSINNRGYNKYLVLKGETQVQISYEKFEADKVWDGLKGYLTNSNMSSKEVISNYQNLWQVEKSFRMSKSDLRFRPIYHSKINRIKAHLLICFTALSVYKRLEYLLQLNKIGMSAEKAISELREIQQISYQLPSSGRKVEQLLKRNENQEKLINLLAQ